MENDCFNLIADKLFNFSSNMPPKLSGKGKNKGKKKGKKKGKHAVRFLYAVL